MSQGMMDGGAVARITAEQGGIGAVQGGDDARLLLRRQHGAREHGGGGMGYGVMHMQNIELAGAADLGHFYGEGSV